VNIGLQNSIEVRMSDKNGSFPYTRSEVLLHEYLYTFMYMRGFE